MPAPVLLFFCITNTLLPEQATQHASQAAFLLFAAIGSVLLAKLCEDARYGCRNIVGNGRVQVKLTGKLFYQATRHGRSNVRSAAAGEKLGEAAQTASQAVLQAAYNVARHFIVYVSGLVCRYGASYLGMIFQLLFYEGQDLIKHNCKC